MVNVALIAVGWGVFTWLVPPYAEAELDIGPQLIGLLLLANAATVAVAQVPIARLAEGRRRVVLMALAPWFFGAACLLVVATGAGFQPAYATLLAAVILVGIGECFHTTVLMPLVADLASAGLRGRYMASMGLSWWMGSPSRRRWAPLLGVSATAPFPPCLGRRSAAGVSALTLERRLPKTARLTPRPHAIPVSTGLEQSASEADRMLRPPRTRSGTAVGSRGLRW